MNKRRHKERDEKSDGEMRRTGKAGDEAYKPDDGGCWTCGSVGPSLCQPGGWGSGERGSMGKTQEMRGEEAAGMGMANGPSTTGRVTKLGAAIANDQRRGKQQTACSKSIPTAQHLPTQTHAHVSDSTVSRIYKNEGILSMYLSLNSPFKTALREGLNFYDGCTFEQHAANA